MKRLKKIVKIAGITLVSLVGLILLSLFLISPGSTSAFKDGQGNLIPTSVAEMKYIELGGIEQFILLRGKDINNPVLLVLHGGPGASEMPMFRKYNNELEEHFVVVHWDQRGAGNSFDENIPDESMTVDQFVEDTHELTLYAKERFKKDKIFLLGHSWGSFLGINTVHKYPDDYIAYIGTGQISNQLESEKLGYLFALEKAEESNDAEAVEALAELGQLNEAAATNEVLNWIFKQREFVGEFGGGTYEINATAMLLSPLLGNREYTVSDKLSFIDGSEFSLYRLFPSVLDTDLSKSAPELNVPVYFLQGEHDYVTSYSLAKEYFDSLKAPQKELFTFNKSGHNPPFEEPDKFNDIMINEILPEAQSARR